MDTQCNWHFNFRNSKKLPDIKTLKKEFYWSIVCASLGLSLFVVYLLMLIYVWGLNIKISKLEKQLENGKVENSNHLEQNRKFQSYAAFLGDIETMYKPIVEPIECLNTIFSSLPNGFIFQNIEFGEKEKIIDSNLIREYTVILEGFIRESEEKALVLINTFKDQCVATDYFKSLVIDLRIDSLKRDSENAQVLNFKISIDLQAK